MSNFLLRGEVNMKIVFINSVCGYGSTGRIVVDLANEYSLRGYDCIIAYGRKNIMNSNRIKTIKIGNKLDVFFHTIITRLFDRQGFGSYLATKEFLRKLDDEKPDIIWLHNLHGNYLNIYLLFDWIKKHENIQVKWTLHDCWAFTGHCTYFSSAKCDRWQTICEKCPQKKKYPTSFLIDNSSMNYLQKKKLFSNVNNMTIVVVSHWLEKLVKKSFLHNYPIEVNYNKVDDSVFQYRESEYFDAEKKCGKNIILGVASIWGTRKGLQDFFELAFMLGEQYQIVLVGKMPKLKMSIPNNMSFIERTDNTIELAKIYSAANYYVCLSKEETFGLTSLEAAKCGTKVIVYKDTACEEIARLYGGIVVEQNLKSVAQAIYEN